MSENTPTPNNVPVIADVNAPVYTNCDMSTTLTRANGCASCVNIMHYASSIDMIDVLDMSRCQLLSLDINVIISANEISCPIGVW